MARIKNNKKSRRADGNIRALRDFFRLGLYFVPVPLLPRKLLAGADFPYRQGFAHGNFGG